MNRRITLCALGFASFMREKFILDKAREYWKSLMGKLGNPNGSEAVFDNLVSRYGESHRGHHNLEHIVMMLEELELLGEEKPDLPLAIWFHDAIYNPGDEDNEEQSAELAEAAIRKFGLVMSLIRSVGDLIMTSKHTEIPNHPIARTMVDLDLVILGRSESEFDKYEAGIRREYAEVPRVKFCAERSQILQSFLGRPSIYLTQHFRSKYEDAARNNLRRAIEQLQR